MIHPIDLARYTGGPAFPPSAHGDGPTLLDIYAGQALIGILAGQLPNGPRDAAECGRVAEEAFNVALAMTCQRRVTLKQIEKQASPK